MLFADDTALVADFIVWEIVSKKKLKENVGKGNGMKFSSLEGQEPLSVRPNRVHLTAMET